MKKIAWVILVTAFFILYLFQHRYSVSCTQELARLEKQKQLLKEEITGLESKEVNTFLFSNLEDTAQQLNLQFPPKTKNSENIQPTQITKTATPVKQNVNTKPDSAKVNKTPSSISAKINE
jgi:hypothetical protein